MPRCWGTHHARSTALRTQAYSRLHHSARLPCACATGSPAAAAAAECVDVPWLCWRRPSVLCASLCTDPRLHTRTQQRVIVSRRRQCRLVHARKRHKSGSSSSPSAQRATMMAAFCTSRSRKASGCRCCDTAAACIRTARGAVSSRVGGAPCSCWRCSVHAPQLTCLQVLARGNCRPRRLAQLLQLGGGCCRPRPAQNSSVPGRINACPLHRKQQLLLAVCAGAPEVRHVCHWLPRVLLGHREHQVASGGRALRHAAVGLDLQQSAGIGDGPGCCRCCCCCVLASSSHADKQPRTPLPAAPAAAGGP